MLVEDLGDASSAPRSSAMPAAGGAVARAVDVLVALRARAGAAAAAAARRQRAIALPRLRPRRASRSRSSCCSTGIGRRSTARRRRPRCAPSSWRCGAPVLDRLLALPRGWVLRDFHSPNLIWLPERDGRRPRRHHRFPGRAQRALRLRPRLAAAGCARRRAGGPGGASCSTYYCARRPAREPAFDRAAFAFAYAAFGAQRNTEILGIFVRLLASRRQAAVSAHHAPHLGISGAQPARIRSWRRWPRGMIGTFRRQTAHGALPG